MHHTIWRGKKIKTKFKQHSLTLLLSLTMRFFPSGINSTSCTSPKILCSTEKGISSPSSSISLSRIVFNHEIMMGKTLTRVRFFYRHVIHNQSNHQNALKCVLILQIFLVYRKVLTEQIYFRSKIAKNIITWRFLAKTGSIDSTSL